MAKRKPKHRGHYCWCCERLRPHEKFSGKGHARHLCKACARLGAAELAYRQALRNLERCMDTAMIISRQHRVSFSRFLSHKDPRIRAVAREMQALDAQTRAEWRQMRREEREIEDHMPETWEDMEVMSPPPIPHTAMDGEDVDDDEIPF